MSVHKVGKSGIIPELKGEIGARHLTKDERLSMEIALRRSASSNRIQMAIAASGDNFHKTFDEALTTARAEAAEATRKGIIKWLSNYAIRAASRQWAQHRAKHTRTSHLR